MMLIDSSVWIDYLKKAATSTASFDRFESLREEEMVTCGIVVTEVLPFISDPHQKAFASNLLLNLTFLSPSNDRFFWESMLQAHEVLKKNGLLQMGLPDVMIMVLAKEHGVSILSLDKHFFKAAKALGIEVWHPKDLLRKL